MPKEQRAELHERFAEWLERVSADRRDEYEEILAHHLEQAVPVPRELGGRRCDPRARQSGRRCVEGLSGPLDDPRDL